MAITVGVLRELFRNLQSWESIWETDNVDVLKGPDGTEYHLADIQYLYECRRFLSNRQKQAIELYLYRDIKERDTAMIMGVSPTNPVGMYATDGLAALIDMVDSGQLKRFTVEQTTPASSSYVTIERIA